MYVLVVLIHDYESGVSVSSVIYIIKLSALPL